jgi:hypothetical protein
MAKRLEQAAIIFIFGTLFSCICSGTWLLNGEMNIVNSLASFRVAEISAGGGLAAPTGISTFWNACVTMFTWDYPYLSSPWALFIKVTLIVISIGFAWEMVLIFIGIFQGIVGVTRNNFG